MSRLRSSSTASLSAPGRTSGRGRSRPSSRSRSPAPPAARSRTRLRVSKPGCAEYTRPQVRQLPGGVSPPVAASSVAPIVGLSGLPASLPRTPSHSPDKPLNFRPDVLASAVAVVVRAGDGEERVVQRFAPVIVEALEKRLFDPLHERPQSGQPAFPIGRQADRVTTPVVRVAAPLDQPAFLQRVENADELAAIEPQDVGDRRLRLACSFAQQGEDRVLVHRDTLLFERLEYP